MNIWLTSDHHWGHEKILTFKDNEGNLTRPQFSTVEEMDEFMLDTWNAHVKPGDKVYHLGDIAMSSKSIDYVLPRLNGSKRLILGNHDIEVKTLIKHFKKISLWRIFKDEGFIATHVPLMASQFRHAVIVNVHGHIHHNKMDDPRYFNVSVEPHNYRPVHIEEISQYIQNLKLLCT